MIHTAPTPSIPGRLDFHWDLAVPTVMEFCQAPRGGGGGTEQDLKAYFVKINPFKFVYYYFEVMIHGHVW